MIRRELSCKDFETGNSAQLHNVLQNSKPSAKHNGGISLQSLDFSNNCNGIYCSGTVRMKGDLFKV